MNENNNIKIFYSNPKWRAGISTGLTVIVGVFSSLLGDWNADQKKFFLKIVGFLFFAFIDLIYVVLCAAQDFKERSLIDALKNENDVYKKAMSGIILVSQDNSSYINECMHDYLSYGKINSKIWNYKTACYGLCATIYEFVIKLTKNEKVEVSYVKLNENTSDEIQLYAYRNQSNQSPTMLNKKRNFSNKDSVMYYDMKMFKWGCAENKVLYGSESINNHFFRTSEDREKNPQKYKEYVAIPVFCNNRKMVGLLQITCLEECSLAENEAALKEIANKFFVPYANLFLLLHKMNKALHLGIDKGGD